MSSKQFIRQILASIEYFQPIVETQVGRAINEAFPSIAQTVEIALKYEETQAAAAALLVLLTKQLPLIQQGSNLINFSLGCAESLEVSGRLRSAMSIRVNICRKLLVDGQLEQALQILDEAEELAEKASLMVELISVLCAKNAVFRFRGELDRCHDILQRIETLRLQVTLDDELLALVYLETGVVNALSIGINPAKEQLEHSLRLFERAGVRRSRWVVLNELARLHQAHDTLSAAKEYYDLAIAELPENSPNRAIIQINLGALYANNEQYEVAETIFRDINLKYLRTIQQDSWIAYTYHGLGFSILSQDRARESQAYLEEAIIYWQKLDDTINLANTLKVLAHCYLALNSHEACNTMRQAAALIDGRFLEHNFVNSIRDTISDFLLQYCPGSAAT